MGYDLEQEAIDLVNELFYRDGPDPKDITRNDAEYVRETVARYLKEAYAAGGQTDVTEQPQNKNCKTGCKTASRNPAKYWSG